MSEHTLGSVPETTPADFSVRTPPPSSVVPLVNISLTLFTDLTGSGIATRALLTPSGILIPLLEYCEEHALSRSLAWAFDVVHAVKLFLSYLLANPSNDWAPLLTSFSQRLHLGTCGSNGEDPSGLYWSPRTWRDAGHQLSYLRSFFEWLERRRGRRLLGTRYLTGSSYDKRMEEVAYQHRRNAALLGHTWPANSSDSALKRHLFIGKRRSPSTTPEIPPAFPENRFDELLEEGFRVKGKPNYRDMLITLLLDKAAMRVSEPFHLYTTDVSEDTSEKGSASVLIHHPSEGLAPRRRGGAQRFETRGSFLRQECGLEPRSERDDSKHAGWKGGLHERAHQSIFIRAYWFPAEYGRLFLSIWNKYLEQTFPIERSHPFALINVYGRPRGDMYSIDKYVKAHAKAVRRIGLEPRKELGTTPHGHRHSYGRRLEEAGVSKVCIMQAMHHSSEKSQEVYTAPGHDKVLEELKAAGVRRGGLL